MAVDDRFAARRESASCLRDWKEPSEREEMTVRLIVELVTPDAGEGDRFFLRSVVLTIEKIRRLSIKEEAKREDIKRVKRKRTG